MNKKVAIVTGGNSGLGLATAKRFCSEGITTYIIGRSEEKLKTALEQLGENGRAKQHDLAQLSCIPTLIQEIYHETGRIDALVNNAGINMKKPFLEVTDEDFASILKVNVQSIFSISRETAKVMKEQGHGSIVNISSMAAKYGLPKVIAYTASKAAIEGMTRAMATELAEFGIKVNCVAPGFIDTPMSSKALNDDPDRMKKVLSRTPMGKLGTPADVGDAVYYLVSNESRFTTGVVLPVDGGNSIGF